MCRRRCRRRRRVHSHRPLSRLINAHRVCYECRDERKVLTVRRGAVVQCGGGVADTYKFSPEPNKKVTIYNSNWIYVASSSSYTSLSPSLFHTHIHSLIHLLWHFVVAWRTFVLSIHLGVYGDMRLMPTRAFWWSFSFLFVLARITPSPRIYARAHQSKVCVCALVFRASLLFFFLFFSLVPLVSIGLKHKY